MVCASARVLVPSMSSLTPCFYFHLKLPVFTLVCLCECFENYLGSIMWNKKHFG